MKPILLGLTLSTLLFITEASSQAQPKEPELGKRVEAERRLSLATSLRRKSLAHIGGMSAEDRRQAVDTYWGEGPSTEVKLQVFDQFWQYVDEKYAAFQGIHVDWNALRERYRPEIAAGVSRGRFAAIINQLSMALLDNHTMPLDLAVNAYTLPEPGVPLLGVGGWVLDTSGACLTAQDDGSALVYSAIAKHPLGLEPGDRILGYEGRSWRKWYRDLLREELPVWPLWWGSSPSAFEHSFGMSAGLNWHLFETMDIAKRGGGVVHLPTSQMQGVIWSDFCSEQMDIPGVAKPSFWNADYVSWGIVEGTRIGYIYIWGWFESAGDEFEQAVTELTQVERVDGLVIDFRFNIGGYLRAPLRGLGVLLPHSVRTIGYDRRKNPLDHFSMENILSTDEFILDVDPDTGAPIEASYEEPIAVLIGPGAASSGDTAALWMSYHPRARTFGKSTSTAFTLPTQPSLGTNLDLGLEWDATVGEAHAFRAFRRDFPRHYLAHRELLVNKPVWLRPEDVAAGKDTVVEAALRWIEHDIARGR
jgi:hypothetical protein